VVLMPSNKLPMITVQPSQRERKASSLLTIFYPSYFPRRLSGLPHCLRPYFAPSVVGISVFVPVRQCISPVWNRPLRRRMPEICHRLLDCSDGLLDCSDSSCSPFSPRLCLFVHDININTVHQSGRCRDFDVTVSFLRSLRSAVLIDQGGSSAWKGARQHFC